MPEPGIAFAVWCVGIVALAALLLPGRAAKAIVAWVAVLLVGMVLAATWL
jgi:hypothetical protein